MNMNILPEKTLAFLLKRSGERVDMRLADRKQRLFKDVNGTVVEIGPGSESSLKYFSKDINYIAVEPNVYFHDELRDAAMKAECHVIAIQGGSADSINLASSIADAVVSSLVLCSVHNPRQVLTEVYRLIKPGGTFYFIEHVVAWDKATRIGQKIIKPFCIVFGGGCHPDRDTLSVIGSCDWQVIYERIKFRDLPFAPLILGKAIKRRQRSHNV